MEKVQRFKRVKDIPLKWDEYIGDNFCLSRYFLFILENANPCQQSYYIFDDENIQGVLITYRHKLNMFTYSFLRFDINTTIIGVPCSVSRPGFNFIKGNLAWALQNVGGIDGATLVLNSDTNIGSSLFTTGNTLPTCVLINKWTDFEEYINAMRSHYRYRINKALGVKSLINFHAIECQEFGEELYNLYLQVYEKSEYKLEKLSISFFQELPAKIIVLEVDDKPIGFVQYLFNQDTMVFMFGGLEYSLNDKFQTYYNMLLYLISVMISSKCKQLDMGQTAEDTKLKLGAEQQLKYMHLNHSNVIFNNFVRKISSTLFYQPLKSKFNVFK